MTIDTRARTAVAVMVTGGSRLHRQQLSALRSSTSAQTCCWSTRSFPDYGGNPFNIADIADRVRSAAPTCDREAMTELVRGQSIIFNLAGQVSHIDSMRDPYTDLDINCRSQLTLLEACCHVNPGAKVVFAGTRQIYGRPDTPPVDESHLVRPTDVKRHQQGGRRAVPPITTTSRRARVFAASHQRIWGASDPLQPSGGSSAGHPAGTEGRTIQITATARNFATSCTRDDGGRIPARWHCRDACNGEVRSMSEASIRSVIAT